MRPYKRNIFCLLFLVYLSVYAASPLIFTLYCENNALCHTKRHSLAQGFVGSRTEDIGGTIVARGDSPSEGPAFWLFVKKKRALLPDDTSEEGLYPDETIPSGQIVCVSSPGAVQVLRPETARHKPKYHQSLLRVHSPPSSAFSIYG